MIKNTFFPSNYKSVYNFAQTRMYIATYVKLLNNAIQNEFHASYIDPPILNVSNHTWDARLNNHRFIAFDNKFVPIIAQLYEDISNYMRLTLTKLHLGQDISIYTYLPIITRDIIHDVDKSMVQQVYHIETKSIKARDDIEIQETFMTNLVSIINAINQNIAFQDYKIQKYFSKNNIKFITLKQLLKLYPSLPIKKALEHYILHNGPTVIHQIYINHDLQSFPFASPSSDDYQNTSILYVYNKIINRVVPLIKISPRPTLQTIKTQLNEYLPSAIVEGIYNKTVLNPTYKLESSIGIQIYFSNIMLLNLHKRHIAEVVHAPWTNEFINYCENNNIDFF